MKLIGNIGKEFINGTDRDVRIDLKRAFQIGASTEEACAYAGVPRATFADWEYTYNCYSDILSLMYAYKLDNFTDITDNMIQEYNNNINLELLNKLKKNTMYGLDVYKLILSCNKAKADVNIYHLSNIYSPKKRKDTDWKASAWYLERTNPERYGRNPAIDEADVIVEKITVEYVDPSKDETKARLEQLTEEVKESIKVV